MVSPIVIAGAGIAILGAKKMTESLAIPESVEPMLETIKVEAPNGVSKYTRTNILLGLFLGAVVVVVLASAISTLVWQPKITDKINEGINELNMSYAILDKRVSALEGKIYVQSGFRGGIDKFTSPEYLNELELFRSLNSQDQLEYLSLTKAQKLLKYDDRLLP